MPAFSGVTGYNVGRLTLTGAGLSLSDEQVSVLEALGREVSAHLELRRTSARLPRC